MAVKALLTGGSGALGAELVRQLTDCEAPSHTELDIRSPKALDHWMSLVSPDVVIHLAALADVRRCELERGLAWQINVLGTRNVVDACKKARKPPMLMFASTACVFDGKTGDYTENSTPDPCNYYGATKAEAEREVQDYGDSLIFRKNFVPRRQWRYPGAFIDRFGTYLFADEVAFVVSQLPESGLRGVIHVVGSEKLSMYDVARITTEDVQAITMKEVDLTLTVDMTLRSSRIAPFNITKTAKRPEDYSGFLLQRISNR
jgi:dTDP-4-dehydrorhamnose reductase